MSGLQSQVLECNAQNDVKLIWQQYTWSTACILAASSTSNLHCEKLGFPRNILVLAIYTPFDHLQLKHFLAQQNQPTGFFQFQQILELFDPHPFFGRSLQQGHFTSRGLTLFIRLYTSSSLAGHRG